MSLLSDLKERNRGPDATDPVFYDDQMDQTIADLNRCGIDFMAVPAAKRHEAFILDRKLTQAANEDRREDFNRLLAKWRQCFN